MSDNKYSLTDYTILFVLIVVGVILLSIFRGWVISILWEWFVVTKFSLPLLSILEAISLSIFISIFQGRPAERKDSGKFDGLAYGIAVPFVALFVGYILKLFMG